jgi:ABC-type antimicrobial peptide transport system permease subunit
MVVLDDARYALRGFRKTPAFTAVALLTLTLAIGANTALFSLLNALVLRDLPVRKPGELVLLHTITSTTNEGAFSLPMFREIARQQRSFSALIGWLSNGVARVDANGSQTYAALSTVTGNYFSELDVRPAAGRLLTEEDVNLPALTGAPVAVLGYSFWQRRFAGDPGAVGRTLRVEGVPLTIVGVAPRGFTGFGLVLEPDVTTPITLQPQLGVVVESVFRSGVASSIRIIGRLKPGVTIDQARAEASTMWPAIKEATVPAAYGGAQRGRFMAARIGVKSAAKGLETRLRDRYLTSSNLFAAYVPALQDLNVDFKCFVIRGHNVPMPELKRQVEALGREYVGSTESLSYITGRTLLQERMTAALAGFFGAVALLLAAVGLYGLMSYSVTQRRREIGIRVALGAEPFRVMTEVVRDGLAVTLGGVVVGFVAALGTSQLVKSILFGITPHDPVTLLAAPTSLIVITVVACFLPAARAARVDPMLALRAE